MNGWLDPERNRCSQPWVGEVVEARIVDESTHIFVIKIYLLPKEEKIRVPYLFPFSSYRIKNDISLTKEWQLLLFDADSHDMHNKSSLISHVPIS